MLTNFVISEKKNPGRNSRGSHFCQVMAYHSFFFMRRTFTGVPIEVDILNFCSSPVASILNGTIFQ